MIKENVSKVCISADHYFQDAAVTFKVAYGFNCALVLIIWLATTVLSFFFTKDEDQVLKGEEKILFDRRVYQYEMSITL